MLFPLLGLILFCVVLTPFAAAYLALQPLARRPSQLCCFYLGSLLWPVLVSAILEFLQLLGLWLSKDVALAVFLAPLAGVALERAWRRESPVPALAISIPMLTGLLFHCAGLASTDLNPNFEDSELRGAWRGRTGALILADRGNWSREGDWGLRLGKKHYRVIRSWGQLCLAEAGDPDDLTIHYRKLPGEPISACVDAGGRPHRRRAARDAHGWEDQFQGLTVEG